MEKFGRIKRVLWSVLCANLLVALVKIGIGTIIKSVSMTADGFHSLADGSANLVGLIAIYFAAKPVDEDHPYGHKKFETVAAVLIAQKLGFLGFKVLTRAVRGLANPEVPAISTASLLVLAGTLVINVFVAGYERKMGKRLQSDILLADSAHTRSDIYITVGVLLALTGIKLGLPARIDSLISLVVAVVIFQAALEIFLTAAGTLTDRAAIDRKTIAELVYQFKEVKDVHQIRSRGRADEVYVDLHIETDPAMSVEEWHQLSHEIEEMIRSSTGKAVQTLIHVEPHVPDAPKQELVAPAGKLEQAKG